MNFQFHSNLPYNSVSHLDEEERDLFEKAMFMVEYLYHLLEKKDTTVVIDRNRNIIHYKEGNLPFNLKTGDILPEETVTSKALKMNAPMRIKKSKEESAFQFAYVGSALPIQNKNGEAIGAIGLIYSAASWDIIQETSSVTSKSIQFILDSFHSFHGSSQKTNKSANEAYEQILTTNKKITNINDVIAMVKKIADQTNMLSLNASIEAARAGDAGKGFEIVASEVGKLANHTKNSLGSMTAGLAEIIASTKLLSEKIENIKNDSNKQDEIILSMKTKVADIIRDLKNMEQVAKKIER